MKTTYAFIDPEGNKVWPISYEKTSVFEVVSVTYTPKIGDPEDPDDEDELEITYVIEEGDIIR